MPLLCLDCGCNSPSTTFDRHRPSWKAVLAIVDRFKPERFLPFKFFKELARGLQREVAAARRLGRDASRGLRD